MKTRPLAQFVLAAGFVLLLIWTVTNITAQSYRILAHIWCSCVDRNARYGGNWADFAL